VSNNASETRVSPVSPVETTEALGGRWVWPPLILAITGLLIWWLGRTPREVHAVATHGAPAQPGVTAVMPLWPDLGAFVRKPLPSQVELSIPERGMEARLLAFIEDESKAVDKETWFDFDRLLFDTGSATLRPESQEQLRNIAEILKAYPAVEVKVGGYTDNVGDSAFNLALSQDRAANVVKELVGLGVVDGRLAAEGYGDKFPVADNATEQGRALNRRISLRVTRK
jgi:OmpA-OmpF porin, OOP family